tara:strand:+ start:296 stop:706 length:411 start_codon:yes stop_codon:yes gene_type:complete
MKKVILLLAVVFSISAFSQTKVDKTWNIYAKFIIPNGFYMSENVSSGAVSVQFYDYEYPSLNIARKADFATSKEQANKVLMEMINVFEDGELGESYRLANGMLVTKRLGKLRFKLGGYKHSFEKRVVRSLLRQSRK